MTPPAHWSRLQKLVWMLIEYNVETTPRYLEKLASFNAWTSLYDIDAELKIQRNGTRKLPEEVAATAIEQIPHNSEDEE